MRWLRRLFGKTRQDRQLDSELTFHIEQRIADLRADGLSPEEAKRQAMLEFGGVERFKDECRDARPETHVQAFFYDLRHAVRNLRKDPRFSLLAIFALALGIGASTIIFSIVYNGVLHPFPYKNAERLVALGSTDASNPRFVMPFFQLTQIDEIRAQSKTLEDVIGYGNWYVHLRTGNGAEMLHGARVTANAMEFLGVSPLIGRPLTRADAQPGAPPVAVLDYKLWKRLYHQDPNVIGQALLLDSGPLTIVGVMPPRFTADGAEFWAPEVPLNRDNSEDSFDNEPRSFFTTAALKPGVSLQQAQADLDVITHHFAGQNPHYFPPKFVASVRSWSDAVVQDFKPVVFLLAIAVAMLLLISCTNVANLLLVRATAREKEIALRASIGASRARLIRQLLTETLVLALAACAAGCLLAWGGLRLVIAKLPPSIPGEADISLNGSVLLFAVGVSLATVLLCGLSPALHAVGDNFRAKLAGAGPGVNTGYRRSRLRSALVIAEIALSMVLLVCAGLTLRSFIALTHVNLGYDPAKILAAHLSFPKDRYVTPHEKREYFEQVLRRVLAIPGVEAVTPSIGVPPDEAGGSIIVIPGKQPQEDSKWNTEVDLCNGDEFAVMQMHLLRGRVLSAEDVLEERYVAVVNETFAAKFFEHENPIGRTFKLSIFDHLPISPKDALFEIVGVVSDVKNRGLNDPTFQEAFLPYTITGFGDRSLLIRTSVDPQSLVETVRREVAAVDADVAFSDASALSGLLAKAHYVAPQFGLFALSAFAIIGLALVVIGVFGLMAYTVSLQKHEIGVRMALGAAPKTILGMVLRRGMRLIVAGVAIGVVAALVAERLLRSQLWGLSGMDALVFASVAAILVTVGLLACWVPAVRATRVDPMTALRYE